MKIQSQSIEQMRKAILPTVNYLKQTAVIPADYNINNLTDADRQHIWFKSWANVAFDDENPNVMRTEAGRICPHDRDFPLYPDNSNDDHVRTALKRIFQEIR